MIGGWMINHGVGAQPYIDLIRKIEAKGVTCSGVVLWWGHGTDMNTTYNLNAGIIKALMAIWPPDMTTLKNRFGGSTPVPTPKPPVNFNLFVRGTDNACWWKPANSTSWQSLGGILLEGTSPSSTIVNNVLYVAVIGTTKEVYMRSKTLTGPWTPWQNLGGGCTSSPSITGLFNDMDIS
jgi:hypothetical protein